MNYASGLFNFLVCIFKYCTSLRVNYVIEIQGYCFYSNDIRKNSTKKRTTATAKADISAVLSPEGVFMMKVSDVILFRSFCFNLQFHCCLKLISIHLYFNHVGTLQQRHHYTVVMIYLLNSYFCFCLTPYYCCVIFMPTYCSIVNISVLLCFPHVYQI